MAEREVELGSGYITVTDHGTLEANRLVYDMCHDKGKYAGKLTPILGLEAYFRPSSCDILDAKGIKKSQRWRKEDGGIVSQSAYEKLSSNKKDELTPESGYWEHLKYLHVTTHFLDQEAYETGVKLLSKADLKAELHGSERKPIFDWCDLEELASKNTVFCSSCLIGFVSRHLFVHGDYETAEKYYSKVRSLAKPGNFYVELCPHVCDKNWEEVVTINFLDGNQLKLPIWRKIKTEAGELKAEDLYAQFKSDTYRALNKHRKIVAVMQNRVMTEIPPKDIATVDYFDGPIQNECTPFAPNGDIMLGANKFVLEMAKKYGDPVVIGDDSHHARPEDKVAQDVRLGQTGGWKFVNNYFRQSSQDAFSYFSSQMGIQKKEFESWIDNSLSWAERFKSFKFKSKKALPTSFYPSDTLSHTMKLIEKHGRMDWNDSIRVNRLKAEIDLLYQNGTIDLLPYFHLCEELCNVYAQNGVLVGPGRGSSAGMYLAYLLGIVHLDALEYNLSMDRFLTKVRIESNKYPDVDMDYPHRDLFVDRENPEKGWLKDRFGDCVAQISTVTTLKLKSAIADVFRAMHGVGSPKLEEARLLAKMVVMPPPGITDSDYVKGYEDEDGHYVPPASQIDPALITISKKFPNEWSAILKTIGLSRSKGRHAAAFLIADEPVSNFIPMTTVGGHRVTSYTMKEVESSGGSKVDLLVVNSLNDIMQAVRSIQDSSNTDVDWQSYRKFNEIPPSMDIEGKRVELRHVLPFKGKFYDIYNLPTDYNVYNEICEGKTETVFQLNTEGAIGWLKQFNFEKSKSPDGTKIKGLSSIEDLSVFTALDRPGPLDVMVESNGTQHNMLVEYANRAKGMSWAGDEALNKAFNELIPETYGVLTYQEQVTKIFQIIGGTSGAEADEFRVHITKKQAAKLAKDKIVFMSGATAKFGESVAIKMWDAIEAWANYGFCLSHAVSYVKISYLCAFLKHHFPQQWWAAVLSNADRKKIKEKFWPYCGHLIDPPDVQDSKDNFCVKDGRIKAPLSLLDGIGEKATQQLTMYSPYSSLQDFCAKIQKHRESGKTEYFSDTIDSKTGLLKRTKKVKLGPSALNSKVMSTLIVAGALDSLFPKTKQFMGVSEEQNLDIVDKIFLFQEELTLATGKKLPAKQKKELIEKFQHLTEIEKFQIKKKLLPYFSSDLLPILVSERLVSKTESGYVVQDTDGRVDQVFEADLIDGIENAEKSGMFPLGAITANCVGYVSVTRFFSYGENKSKTAVEVELDIGNHRVKMVQWPGKKGLPSEFDRSLDGSIVLLTIQKEHGKDLRLLNLKQLFEPLDFNSKEEEE